MATVAQALARFRESHAAMLIAAADLCATVEARAGATSSTPPDLLKIIELVAGHFGLGRELLIGRNRKSTACHARLMAMALCRACTPHGLDVIATAFARTHSMVLYSVRTTRNRCDTEPAFRRDYERVGAIVTAALKGS